MSARARPVADLPSRRPRVSVVIPCYNYGHYLPDAVGSALDQAGVEVDVLIVDDASTDDSADVAERLALADTRVRLIRHRRNAGHIATYNEGLAAIDGDHVVLISADDLLASGSLGRAAAVFEAHPSVGLVYGRPVHFTESPAAPGRPRPLSWTIWPGHEWLARRYRLGTNCISSPEAIMRTSTLRELGGYRPELPHTADLEMWLRAAGIADVGRINGVPQAYYRVHPRSMQRSQYSGMAIDLKGRRDAFVSALDFLGDRISDREELDLSVRRALATVALDKTCQAYDRGRTDTFPVDELIEFAQELWPDYASLREWKALTRRRQVGPRLAPLVPPFAAHAAYRRAALEMERFLWRRTGV